ncbi:hypothetical protein [Streptomyces sp. CRN 30]|uniref:hypothetical protein n=1 Tax=Streptomyces sp. CRN 30 TaxID=3075613 RepID=UPI002A7F5634|nr:hypothetical protein [Streptomyces sp. CRN 30]
MADAPPDPGTATAAAPAAAAVARKAIFHAHAVEPERSLAVQHVALLARAFAGDDPEGVGALLDFWCFTWTGRFATGGFLGDEVLPRTLKAALQSVVSAGGRPAHQAAQGSLLREARRELETEVQAAAAANHVMGKELFLRPLQAFTEEGPDACLLLVRSPADAVRSVNGALLKPLAMGGVRYQQTVETAGRIADRMREVLALAAMVREAPPPTPVRVTDDDVAQLSPAARGLLPLVLEDVAEGGAEGGAAGFDPTPVLELAEERLSLLETRDALRPALALGETGRGSPAVAEARATLASVRGRLDGIARHIAESPELEEFLQEVRADVAQGRIGQVDSLLELARPLVVRGRRLERVHALRERLAKAGADLADGGEEGGDDASPALVRLADYLETAERTEDEDAAEKLLTMAEEMAQGLTPRRTAPGGGRRTGSRGAAVPGGRPVLVPPILLLAELLEEPWHPLLTPALRAVAEGGAEGAATAFERLAAGEPGPAQRAAAVCAVGWSVFHGDPERALHQQARLAERASRSATRLWNEGCARGATGDVGGAVDAFEAVARLGDSPPQLVVQPVLDLFQAAGRPCPFSRPPRSRPVPDARTDVFVTQRFEATAKRLRLGRRSTDAELVLEALTEVCPTAPGRSLLMKIYREEHRLADAERFVSRMSARDAGDSKLTFDLALVACESGDLSRAGELRDRLAGAGAPEQDLLQLDRRLVQPRPAAGHATAAWPVPAGADRPAGAPARPPAEDRSLPPLLLHEDLLPSDADGVPQGLYRALTQLENPLETAQGLAAWAADAPGPAGPAAAACAIGWACRAGEAALAAEWADRLLPSDASGWLLWNRACAQELLGRAEDAADTLERAVETGDQVPPVVWPLVAERLAESGRAVSPAPAPYGSPAASRPPARISNPAMQHFESLAKRLFTVGRRRDAEWLLRALVEAAPRSPGLLLLMKIWREDRRIDDALALVSQRRARGEADWRLCYEAGLVAVAAGRPNVALDMRQQVVALGGPGDWVAQLDRRTGVPHAPSPSFRGLRTPPAPEQQIVQQALSGRQDKAALVESARQLVDERGPTPVLAVAQQLERVAPWARLTLLDLLIDRVAEQSDREAPAGLADQVVAAGDARLVERLASALDDSGDHRKATRLLADFAEHCRPTQRPRIWHRLVGLLRSHGEDEEADRIVARTAPPLPSEARGPGSGEVVRLRPRRSQLVLPQRPQDGPSLLHEAHELDQLHGPAAAADAWTAALGAGHVLAYPNALGALVAAERAEEALELYRGYADRFWTGSTAAWNIAAAYARVGLLTEAADTLELEARISSRSALEPADRLAVDEVFRLVDRPSPRGLLTPSSASLIAGPASRTTEPAPWGATTAPPRRPPTNATEPTDGSREAAAGSSPREATAGPSSREAAVGSSSREAAAGSSSRRAAVDGAGSVGGSWGTTASSSWRQAALGGGESADDSREATGGPSSREAAMAGAEPDGSRGTTAEASSPEATAGTSSRQAAMDGGESRATTAEPSFRAGTTESSSRQPAAEPSSRQAGMDGGESADDAASPASGPDHTDAASPAGGPDHTDTASPEGGPNHLDAATASPRPDQPGAATSSGRAGHGGPVASPVYPERADGVMPSARAGLAGSLVSPGRPDLGGSPVVVGRPVLAGTGSALPRAKPEEWENRLLADSFARGLRGTEPGSPLFVQQTLLMRTQCGQLVEGLAGEAERLVRPEPRTVGPEPLRRMSPATAEAFTEGLAMARDNRWHDAAALWRTVYEAHPRNEVVANDLVLALLETGEFDLARQLVDGFAFSSAFIRPRAALAHVTGGPAAAVAEIARMRDEDLGLGRTDLPLAQAGLEYHHLNDPHAAARTLLSVAADRPAGLARMFGAVAMLLGQDVGDDALVAEALRYLLRTVPHVNDIVAAALRDRRPDHLTLVRGLLGPGPLKRVAEARAAELARPQPSHRRLTVLRSLLELRQSSSPDARWLWARLLWQEGRSAESADSYRELVREFTVAPDRRPQLAPAVEEYIQAARSSGDPARHREALATKQDLGLPMRTRELETLRGDEVAQESLLLDLDADLVSFEAADVVGAPLEAAHRLDRVAESVRSVAAGGQDQVLVDQLVGIWYHQLDQDVDTEEGRDRLMSLRVQARELCGRVGDRALRDAATRVSTVTYRLWEESGRRLLPPRAENAFLVAESELWAYDDGPLHVRLVVEPREEGGHVRIGWNGSPYRLVELDRGRRQEVVFRVDEVYETEQVELDVWVHRPFAAEVETSRLAFWVERRPWREEFASHAFDAGSPAGHRVRVPRENELTRLRNHYRDRSVAPVRFLHGPRQVGKTTLARSLSAHPLPSEPAEWPLPGVLAVDVNGEWWSHTYRVPLWTWLADQVRESARKAWPAGVSWDRPDPVNAYEFRQWLVGMRLAGLDGWRLLLMVDEFQTLLDRVLESGEPIAHLGDQLRAMVSDRDTPLLLLTLGSCSFESLKERLVPHGSNLTDEIREFPVGFMEPEQARTIFKRGFDDSVFLQRAIIDRVVEYTGGYPYHVHCMGEELAKLLGRRKTTIITLDDVESAASTLVERPEVSKPFSDMERERGVAEAVAYLLEQETEPDELTIDGDAVDLAPDPTIDAGLRRIKDLGLIRGHGHRDWVWSNELIHIWLKQRHARQLLKEQAMRAARSAAAGPETLPEPAADQDGPADGTGTGAGAGADTDAGTGDPAEALRRAGFELHEALGAQEVDGFPAARKVTLHGRPVVAKLLNADGDAACLDALLARFRALARSVSSGAPVPLREQPVVGDSWFLFEWTEGRTFTEVMRDTGRRPYVWRQALRWVADAADIVGRAYREGGLTHGDLKPDNLLVADDDRVTVLDWGGGDLDGECSPVYDAHAFDERYAPAEQVIAAGMQQERPGVRASDDAYALAATLFQMVHPKQTTLHALAAGGTDHGAFYAIGAQTSLGLSGVLQQALMAPLDLRFQDASALADALRKVPSS